MSKAEDDTASLGACDPASLEQEFPGFRIFKEITGERVRLVAVRRHRGTSPHTVVTADIAELRAMLGSSSKASASP